MWKKVGGNILKEMNDPRGINSQANTKYIGWIYTHYKKSQFFKRPT